MQPLHPWSEATIQRFSREPLLQRSQPASHCQFLEDQALRDELVKTFLLSEVCKVFGLQSERLLSDSRKNYGLARRACYHLLVHHTSISKSEIGRHFQQSRQQVHYQLSKCEQELKKQQSNPYYTSKFLTSYEALQNKLLEFFRQISTNMKHPNESTFHDEIQAALSVSEENIPLEGNLPADESPLNDPVSEGDIGIPQPTNGQMRQNNQTETNRTGHSKAGSSRERQFDASATDAAPPQQATDSVKDQDDRPEPPDEHQLGLQADSYLGLATYLIDMGGGFLVKMKKHPEFYEFEEIVEMIDQMNEQNMKHIQLSEEEKAMLRPLIIEVLRTSKKQMSTKGHLLMSGAAILFAKIRVAMTIHAEMKVQTQNILEAIREKSPSKQSETEVPKNQDTSGRPSSKPFDEGNHQDIPGTIASDAEENNPEPEVSDDSPPESGQTDTGSSMNDEAITEAVNEVMKEVATRDSDQNESVSHDHFAEVSTNNSPKRVASIKEERKGTKNGADAKARKGLEKEHPESMEGQLEGYETVTKKGSAKETNQAAIELTEASST